MTKFTNIENDISNDPAESKRENVHVKMFFNNGDKLTEFKIACSPT